MKLGAMAASNLGSPNPNTTSPRPTKKALPGDGDSPDSFEPSFLHYTLDSYSSTTSDSRPDNTGSKSIDPKLTRPGK